MRFLSKLTVGVFLLYLTVVLFVAAVILAVLATVGPAKAMGNTPDSDYSNSLNTDRVHVEMELISGSMICATYNLPKDRGPFYIGAYRGEYTLHYETNGRQRLLRNAVIFAREVERCDFVHKGVYNQ
jgi:hypothetical protein